MANYATLTAAIQEVIKTNGNKEITGALLQQSLLAMVNSLGADYQFAGVAIPATNPGTPDTKVAYVAGPGTYPNFGGAVIPEQYVGIIKGSGSTWNLSTIKVSPFRTETIIDDIIQLYDGTTPVYPRTKGDAVFFGSDTTDTLKKVAVFTNAGNGHLELKIGNVVVPITFNGKFSNTTELNSCVNTGVYVGEGGTTLNDTILLVRKNGNNIYQFRLYITTAGVSCIQIRNSTDNGSTWGDWENFTYDKAEIDSQLNAIRQYSWGINKISGVGTSAINSVLETTSTWLTQVDDNESPFAGILDKYSKIELTAQNFVFEPRDSRSAQFSKIKFSIWVNEDDYSSWNTDWSSYFDFFIITYSPSFAQKLMRCYIKNALGLAVGASQNFLNLGNIHTHAAKIGKWHQIIIERAYSSYATYGFQLQFPAGNYRIVNPQILFDNEPVPVGVVVIKDENDVTVPYPVSLDMVRENLMKQSNDISELQEQESALDARTETLENKVSTLYVEPTNTLRWKGDGTAACELVSKFNEQKNLRAYSPNIPNRIASQESHNSNVITFNFAAMQFISRNGGDTENIYAPNDDVSPANYNGGYVGANHAPAVVQRINCPSHGKTYADIGSKWTNGSKNFYIVLIQNDNYLWVVSDNEAEYPLWSFASLSANQTLTHVSGATHTDSISIQGVNAQQLFPCNKNVKTEAFIDGVSLMDKPTGTYKYKEFVVVNIYDIINPASLLEKIKAAVGTFTANPHYLSLGADVVARHTLIYRFVSSFQCFVETSFNFFQNVDFANFSMTQFGSLANGTPQFYIPKTLTLQSGKKFWNWDTNPASGVDFTSGTWENPLSPPDRVITKDDKIACSFGYLFDYGIGNPKRKDFITNAMRIETTNKVYPHAVDNNQIGQAGTSVSGVCFRRYIDLAEINQNGVISVQQFKYNNRYYIFADYNAAGNYTLQIPEEYYGKQINVFEKSENVDLMTKMGNAELLVHVASATNMYGYLVAYIDL